MALKLPKGNPCAWIRSVAKPGDTVIDGGANKGEFTLAAAEAVGENGLVVAVEPDPRCGDSLRKIAGAHRQVRYIDAALEMTDAGALLTQSQHPEQSSLLSVAVKHPVGTIQVQTVLLNDLARGPIAAVKLDLQGGELNAIWGGTELFAKCPRWCVELWPWAQRDNLPFLLGLFKSFGFSLHTFADGYPQVPYEDVVAWGTEGYEPHTHCNVIFQR